MSTTRWSHAVVEWRNFFVFALLGVSFGSLVGAEESPSLPRSFSTAAARWDSIEITGNESFSDAEIINELFAQPEFLIANHPFGDHEEFPLVVGKLLVKGYRCHGFRDVSIELEHTTDPEPPSTAE